MERFYGLTARTEAMRTVRTMLIAVMGTLLCTASAWAGRLELDVAIEAGFPVGDLQRWNAMLGEVGFDAVRIGNPGGATAKIVVEPLPSADGKSFKVSGVLTRGGQILLPGGKFGLNDRAAISVWATKVRSEGAPLAPGQKKSPFGIEPLTLDLVRKDLGRVADFSTLQKSPIEVLTDVGNRCQYQVVAEPDIAATLGRAEKVPGELKGLACGTVVAAVLRREGMSLVPAMGVSGRPEYTIVRATKDQDVWPIGWVPERPLPEVVPDMFTLRNVAIDDYAANELLQVVADRLKLPMLFDEQALVLKKLDPSKVKVKIPEGQMGYEAVLDRAMFQSGLKHEVRLDDGGRPFLWITSRTP
jgi:hypothetical protein